MKNLDLIIIIGILLIGAGAVFTGVRQGVGQAFRPAPQSPASIPSSVETQEAQRERIKKVNEQYKRLQEDRERKLRDFQNKF